MIHLLALKVVTCDSCKGGYPSATWQVDEIVAFLQRREVFGYLDEEPIGALVAAAWHGWRVRASGGHRIGTAGLKNERHVIQKQRMSSRGKQDDEMTRQVLTGHCVLPLVSLHVVSYGQHEAHISAICSGRTGSGQFPRRAFVCSAAATPRAGSITNTCRKAFR